MSFNLIELKLEKEKEENEPADENAKTVFESEKITNIQSKQIKCGFNEVLF